MTRTAEHHNRSVIPADRFGAIYGRFSYLLPVHAPPITGEPMTEKNGSKVTTDERLRGAIGDALEELEVVSAYIDTLDFALLGMERMGNANVYGRCPAIPVVSSLSVRLRELSERLKGELYREDGEGA